MKPDFAKLSKQTSELLGVANGLELTQSRLTPQGIELIFASGDIRAEVRFLPKVYTAGMVIVDAINDLTITIELKKFRLVTDAKGASSAETIFDERIELPYSVWFEEGEYR